MKRSLLLSSCLLMLAACGSATMHPDYAIRVTPTETGGIATAPTCPTWSEATYNAYDNLPPPQLGCATARNLAGMVERPDDLLDARQIGAARGVTTVGAIRRYDNNQTRGLIIPGAETNQTAATTGTATSAMTGDVTGSVPGSATPATTP